MTRAFDHIPNTCLRILDTHDKFTARDDLLVRNGAELGFFWTTAENEAQGLRRAQVILAISENEATFFRSLVEPSRVITIGHIAQCSELCPREASGPLRIGFIGSMNAVNTTSIQALLSDYASLPLSEGGVIELHICGPICQKLGAWRDYRGVKLLGEVDHPSDFYRRVDCVAVPMDFGTGQSIKYIEALSYGIPILATRAASGSIQSGEDDHCLADSSRVLRRALDIANARHLIPDMSLESKKKFDIYTASVGMAFDNLVNTIFTHIDRRSRSADPDL